MTEWGSTEQWSWLHMLTSSDVNPRHTASLFREVNSRRQTGSYLQKYWPTCIWCLCFFFTAAWACESSWGRINQTYSPTNLLKTSTNLHSSRNPRLQTAYITAFPIWIPTLHYWTGTQRDGNTCCTSHITNHTPKIRQYCGSRKRRE